MSTRTPPVWLHVERVAAHRRLGESITVINRVVTAPTASANDHAASDKAWDELRDGLIALAILRDLAESHPPVSRYEGGRGESIPEECLLCGAAPTGDVTPLTEVTHEESCPWRRAVELTQEQP